MATILVVDDSKVERRLAAGLLRHNEEWEVVELPGAGEALSQLAISDVDLVVTDLVMPRMNGRQLVEVMRKRHPHVPVVVTTSRGNEQIAVRALQLGAASYVSKKRLAEDLVNTVRQVLARSQEEQVSNLVMQRMKRNHARFCVRSEPHLIGPLAGYYRDLLACMDFCRDNVLSNVIGALEEALMNALYHGNLEANSSVLELDREQYIEVGASRCEQEPWCERRIHVESEITPDTVTFRIRDEGRGFDTSQLPAMSSMEDMDRPKGRGVVLMHQFMDSVSYNESGNEVCLVKHRRDNAAAADGNSVSTSVSTDGGAQPAAGAEPGGNPESGNSSETES